MVEDNSKCDRHSSSTISVALVYPPVSKPSEPPAGIARLDGALHAYGIRSMVVDANVRGLNYLLNRLPTPTPQDTWGKRALRHRQNHIASLQSAEIYRHPGRYRRAVADVNRLLATVSADKRITITLADYADADWSPVRRRDLIQSAENPRRNPFFDYYRKHLLPELTAFAPDLVGLSINYLSQALCAFALIGMIRRSLPHTGIVIGGGLVTSWLQHGGQVIELEHLVDRMVSGPGEGTLLQMVGVSVTPPPAPLPDYTPFLKEAYLSPGLVIPYSASAGCWWRRCAFCPEHAEAQPFRPLPHSVAVSQLQTLSRQYRPTMIHLLDNALSPALLKALTAGPPGAPWYGFARFGPPLDSLDFCRHMADSGCAMLKLGLESGDQRVLDALEKGIWLETASRVLKNLHAAGISTYVYLLFGTPSEDEPAAIRTMQFVADHHDTIDYLNTALFNLPRHSPEAAGLECSAFYDGDLPLYINFKHPKGWSRSGVRRFVEKKFKRHPAIRPIVLRDPPFFTSNHAAFMDYS